MAHIIKTYSKLFKFLKDESNIDDKTILDILHEERPFIDLEYIENLDRDDIQDYVKYYQIPSEYISFLKYRRVDYLGMY